MTKINVKGPIVSNDSAWLYRWLGWDACCVNDINTGLESANGDDVVIDGVTRCDQSTFWHDCYR